MPRMLLQSKLAFLAVAVLLSVLPDGAALGEVHFPSDPSLPYKFGVFIGINKYPHLSERNQLDGSVHDAETMQRLFADAFQVRRSVLLTDGEATRQGIGEALEELVRQVKAARARTQDPIDVVITYSGHGTRVMRLPGENDPNGMDNAWVASDSTARFDEVVRGHELLEIHMALAKLNVQVLIISDSCYSGSGYRGAETAKARFVSDGAQDAIGPKDDLFQDLPADGSAPGSVLPSENEPLPGFVYYSACGDGEEAHEYTDPATNQPWGRFTFALTALLRKHNPELTYDELAGDITVKFASLWPGQHPEFHAAPGKGGDLFLHAGDRPPLNALILSANADGTRELNLGSLDGVTNDSHFRFYASLDDLVNHGRVIGSAVVTNVTPVTCTVKPEGGVTIPANARAMMDEVRMTDFVVGIDGDVPQPIRDMLQRMDGNEQIRLAAEGAACSLAIHYDPQQHTVGFYLPSALPGGSREPAPLRRVGYTGPADAEVVAENLLYVARVQRLMTLKQEGTDRLLAAEIDPTGPPSPATRPADGLAHLREGSQLLLKLTNKTRDVPLYFWVFVVGADGSLVTLYPTAGETEPVPAGQSLEIGHHRILKATIDQGDLPSGAGELTTLKVIATTRYLDLQALAVAPSTNIEQLGTKGARGADDPLMDLLMDAAQGGAGTRGMFSLPPETIWDTTDLAVDVIKD